MRRNVGGVLYPIRGHGAGASWLGGLWKLVHSSRPKENARREVSGSLFSPHPGDDALGDVQQRKLVAGAKESGGWPREADM